MKFFNGMRPPGSGGSKASDAFKQSMKKDAKPMTTQEKYKKMLEDKLSAGQQQNAGGRTSFTLPGTAAPTQEKKELSKNMKMILDQVAATKAKKDAKRNKKLAKEDAREKKAAIRAEQVKKQKDATQAASTGKSGLFGNSEAPKNPTGSGLWGGGTAKKDDGGWW